MENCCYIGVIAAAKNPLKSVHNWFDFFGFSWLNPIFEIGSKRNLEINDVYNVLEEDSSKYVTDKLEKSVSEWKLSYCYKYICLLMNQ